MDPNVAITTKLLLLQTRKMEGGELGARGAGVGADSPLPSTQEEVVAVDDEFLTLPSRLGHAASPPHAPKVMHLCANCE